MAEYIEREAAIEAVCGCVPHSCDIGSCGFACSEAYALSKLPAADVRPVVRGQWVESKSIMDVIYCSECGFRTIYGAMPDGLGRNYSYCPNCGADMREVTDG